MLVHLFVRLSSVAMVVTVVVVVASGVAALVKSNVQYICIKQTL